MFKEQRKSPRRVINLVAQFRCDVGSLPRSCMITNISDDGARLYSETELPEKFVLSVSGDGVDVHRECQVVWRLGGEFGVKFVGRVSL